MIFGSMRAADHLFRVIGGTMLILVVIRPSSPEAG